MATGNHRPQHLGKALATALLFVLVLIHGSITYSLPGTVIDSVTPDTLTVGAVSVELVMDGEEFDPAVATIEFSEPAIVIEDFEVLSWDTMVATVTVLPHATPGPVTIIFNDGTGPPLEFDGLLTLLGAPTVTGMEPLELTGPETEQTVTLLGEGFSADWLAALDKEAVFINPEGDYPLPVTVDEVGGDYATLTVPTEEIWYLDPCMINFSFTDPVTGAAWFFSLPILVEAPPVPVLPEIDDVEQSSFVLLELGAYPLSFEVEFDVTGSNFPPGSSSSPVITSNDLNHLTLASPGDLSVEVHSATSATLTLECDVISDDGSGEHVADGVLDFELWDNTVSVDYLVEMLWPEAELTSMEINQVGNEVTVIDYPDIEVIDGEVTAWGWIYGDYLMSSPHPDVVETMEITCPVADIVMEGWSASASNNSSAALEINVEVLSIDAPLPAWLECTLTATLGTTEVSCPVSIYVHVIESMPSLDSVEVTLVENPITVETYPDLELVQASTVAWGTVYGENLGASPYTHGLEALEIECPDADISLAEWELHAGFDETLQIRLVPEVSDIVVPPPASLECTLTAILDEEEVSCEFLIEVMPLSIPPQLNMLDIYQVEGPFTVNTYPDLEIVDATTTAWATLVGENLASSPYSDVLESLEVECTDADVEFLEWEAYSSDNNTCQLRLVPELIDISEPIPPYLDCTVTVALGDEEITGDMRIYITVLSLEPMLDTLEVTQVEAPITIQTVPTMEVLEGETVIWAMLNGTNLTLPVLEEIGEGFYLYSAEGEVDVTDVEIVASSEIFAEYRLEVECTQVEPEAALGFIDCFLRSDAVTPIESWQFPISCTIDNPQSFIQSVELLEILGELRIRTVPEIGIIGGEYEVEFLIEGESFTEDLPLEVVLGGQFGELFTLEPLGTRTGFEFVSPEEGIWRGRLIPDLSPRAGRLLEDVVEDLDDFVAAWDEEEDTLEPLELEFEFLIGEEGFQAEPVLGPLVQVNPVPQVLDIFAYLDEPMPSQPDFPAESFFDVYVEIEGENLAPGLFEGALATIAPVDPDIRLLFVAGEPEDLEGDDEAVTLVLPVEISGQAPLTEEPLEVRLLLEPVGEGAPRLRTVFDIEFAGPSILKLVVPEDQMLDFPPPGVLTTGDPDEEQVVELRLDVEFLIGEDQVTNIRGLRVDEDDAAEAFTLMIGDEELKPAEFRLVGSEQLVIAVPAIFGMRGEFQETDTGLLIVEPEDLVLAFSPEVETEQSTLEFEFDIPWPQDGAAPVFNATVELNVTGLPDDIYTPLHQGVVELGPHELLDLNEDGTADEDDAELTLARPRFFSGQMLRAEDLNMEQEYIQESLRMPRTGAVGCGIVCGLNIKIEQLTPQEGATLVLVVGPVLEGDELLLGCELGWYEGELTEVMPFAAGEVPWTGYPCMGLPWAVSVPDTTEQAFAEPLFPLRYKTPHGEGESVVQVKLPWLLDDGGEGEDFVTDWERITEMMGGEGRGFFLLPEVGDEVFVEFEQGVLQQPVVLGTIWGAQPVPEDDDEEEEEEEQPVQPYDPEDPPELILTIGDESATALLITPLINEEGLIAVGFALQGDLPDYSEAEWDPSEFPGWQPLGDTEMIPLSGKVPTGPVAELHTQLMLITPEPEDGLFYGSLIHVEYIWHTFISEPPVFDESGKLIGVLAQEDATGEYLLEPEAVADLLTETGQARLVLTTGEGEQTVKPLTYTTDGTAFATFDIGDVPEGMELEVKDEVDPKAPIPLGLFNDLDLTGPEEGPLELPMFADAFESGTTAAWSGWKPEEMPEAECYAAREEAEKGKEEYEREKKKRDCSKEYQAYLDALKREEMFMRQRRNAGDDWTLHQERAFMQARAAREAAWAAYEECMKDQWAAYGKWKAADSKAIGCTAPPKGKDDSGGGGEDGKEGRKKSVHFQGSATGPRRAGSAEITLDYMLPAVPDDGADSHDDDTDDSEFTPFPESGFPGFAELKTEAEDSADEAPAAPETDALPLLQVEISDGGENGIWFHPLLYDYAADDGEHGSVEDDGQHGDLTDGGEYELVVGVSLGAETGWPAGFTPVGDPVLLPLEPVGGEEGPPAVAKLTTEITCLTPAPENGLFYGSMVYLDFLWHSFLDKPPVLDDAGRLVGVEHGAGYSPEHLLDPEAIADLLTGAGQVKLVMTTGEGEQFVEPLVFENDGTAHASFDIEDLPAGLEFEIKDEVEEEKDIPVGESPFKPWVAEDDFDYVESEMVVIVIIDGEKPEAMPEKECYAAREEAEKDKEDWEREKKKRDCSAEYQAYLDALRREEMFMSMRRNAGDDWTLHQERAFMQARAARKAAWDAYNECVKAQRMAEAKWKVSSFKAVSCTAPKKDDVSGGDDKEDD